MKNTVFLLLFLISFLSCTKLRQDYIVTRDCTGTYLRKDNKDYHICNWRTISNVTEGAIISARIKPICNCPEFDTLYFCEMYHPNEGMHEIVNWE